MANRLTNTVSIPNGSIKIKFENGNLYILYEFQFQMVRLKWRIW